MVSINHAGGLPSNVSICTPAIICNSNSRLKSGESLKRHGRLLQAISNKCGVESSRETEARCGIMRESLESLGFDLSEVSRLPLPSLHRCCQKIEFLIHEGFSLSQVNTLMGDLSRPTVFHSISLSKIASVLEFLKTLDITGDKAVAICIWYPRIFTNSVRSLHCRVQFFESLGIERPRLRSLVTRNANILTGAIDTMETNILLLQDLGMGKDEIRKLLAKSPMLLCRDVERNVKPKLAFFEKCFQDGATRTNLFHRLLTRRPDVLTSSLVGLSSKMALLQELGFEKNSKELLVALFELSISGCDNIQAKFNHLVTLGFTRDQAIRLVQRAPRVLGRSEQTLSRKVSYFVDVLNRDPEEIVRFPVCLLFSMEKRILPRFEALADKRAKGILKVNYSLSYILACTDKAFRKKFLNAMESEVAKTH